MKYMHAVVLNMVTSLLLAVPGGLYAAGPDLIVFDGKVVTVDAGFSVHQAMAVESNRIVAVGRNDEIVKLKTDKTEMLDLKGKMVLPGLFDSHTHPVGAALIEFDHPIPDMETIQDVLNYFKNRAEAVKEGEWIVLQQVFITRLREQRYPTRAELDQVAPKNPVVFRTGPDASVNTLALKLSGIDKDFRVTDGGTGYAEKDPKTGEPTGILRNLSRYLKIRESGRQADGRASGMRECCRYSRIIAPWALPASVTVTRSRRNSIFTSRCWKRASCRFASVPSTMWIRSVLSRRSRRISAKWRSFRCGRAGRCCALSASKSTWTAEC